MVTKIEIYACTKCESIDIVKNGRTKSGKQKYRCNTCNKYGTLNPSPKYSEARKAEILRAYHERSSLRGLERTFGVSRQTIAKWIKKNEANSLT